MRVRSVVVVLVTLALLAAAPSASAAIVFTRIQYNSPGVDNGSNASLNAEWATVKNTGKRAVQLRRWKVRDRAGHTYTFGLLRLRPGRTVRLHTGSGTNTAAHRYWGQDWYVWNNTGDTAVLRDRRGRLRDRCTWGDGPGTIDC